MPRLAAAIVCRLRPRRWDRVGDKLVLVTAIACCMAGSLSFGFAQAADSQARIESSYPPLPRPIASFGAAICNNWLYVYGGHIGKTHEHSRENLWPAFQRLNLRQGGTWQELPFGQALQSPTLVAHEGSLYLVGGLTALNAAHEGPDLHSVADCARYDTVTATWHPLPPLPEARSSHDAVMIGESLYVAGGWNLQGNTDDAVWHQDVLSLPLTEPATGWQTVASMPFQRRALTVAALRSELWVIGGLQPDGGFSRSVDILDTKTGTWRSGPELPGQDRNGFAASAFAMQGRIHVSGRDGRVLRLAEDHQRWEPIAALATPRFFHRLLPYGDQELLILGGAGDGGHIRSIESVTVEPSSPTPRVQVLDVALPEQCEALLPILSSEGRIYAAARIRYSEGEATATLSPTELSARQPEGATWTHLLCWNLGQQDLEWQCPFPSALQTICAASREVAGKRQLLALGNPTQAEPSRIQAWTLDIERLRWRRVQDELPTGRLCCGFAGSSELHALIVRTPQQDAGADGAFVMLECDVADPKLRFVETKLTCVNSAVDMARLGDSTVVAHRTTNGAIELSLLGPTRHDRLPTSLRDVTQPQIVPVGDRIALIDRSLANTVEIVCISRGNTASQQAIDTSLPWTSATIHALPASHGLFILSPAIDRPNVLRIAFVDCAMDGT